MWKLCYNLGFIPLLHVAPHHHHHQNYTDIGFKKIKAPEKVFKLIKAFWDANKDKEQKETWGTANTYT